jgi:hypothetical protein
MSLKVIQLLILCLLVLTTNTYSQKKQITQKDYDSVQTVAENNFERLAYRELTKIENYENGKLVSTETITEENLPPDKMNWRSIKVSNGNSEKEEIITIGYVTYRRENGGKWIKEDNEDGDIESNNGVSTNSITSISGQEAPNRKKYTVEETKLKNLSVRIYSVTTVYDFAPNVSHTFRRWINSDNLILKAEDTESENGANVISRTVSTYEYNPKGIKIEAPKIN